MATKKISLEAGAWGPSNDATNFASAQLQVKQSSATVPSPRWLEWLFDATTDEFIVTQFVLPSTYVDSPSLDVFYKLATTPAAATTMAWEVRIFANTPGSDTADMDADSLEAVNPATGTTSTANGFLSVISVPLTNANSMAAGDIIVMSLNRDVSVDDTSGDVEFVGAHLKFSDA